MKKEIKINDLRNNKLERVLSDDYIPFLQGRPERPTIISEDEILNLKIALNQNLRFDEFLKQV